MKELHITKGIVRQRLSDLRRFMAEHDLSAFIIPSTDPHAGEYIAERWEARKWLTGFSGSAGIAVVTHAEAGLWTDSRYYLQAEEQLKDTEINLFKSQDPDCPTIPRWLSTVLSKGDKIGFDGWVNSISDIQDWDSYLRYRDLKLVSVTDPFDYIWKQRPQLPAAPPFILPEANHGETCVGKLERLRQELEKLGCDGMLVTALDEIAWLLNMRGCDIPYNPLFIGYLLISPHHTVLFIQPDKLTDGITDYLKDNGVITRPYRQIGDGLQQYDGHHILLPGKSNYAAKQLIRESVTCHISTSPVQHMKAIKNQVEIAGFHKAMLRDGVAMVRFLKWLEEAVHHGTETEMSICRKLYHFRSQQELFQGPSFHTIAGYQDHGAIVHYETDPETDVHLKEEGLLLIDSGGQYLDGTTDITRTIALGPVTEKQRTDYTLVLKGFIALATAEFPQGTCGTQLDILARQYMWKKGINYGHGTGHGVGHFLNVHEGPQQIRMNYIQTPLSPGMTITNEPGIYRAGEYGIRTENTMLVIPVRITDFGIFYGFEQLTLCPIDCTAIRPELLTPEECSWLNQYHQKVYQELSPLLDPEEQLWLKKKTEKNLWLS